MPRRYNVELFLKEAELFRNLTAKERQRLAAFSHERSFEKGQTIFQEGTASDSIWLVMEGRVHLLHHLSSGRAQTSCVLTGGESFCCLPALDRGTYPATAVAAIRSKILQIPSDLFHSLMQKSPALLKETLCVFGGRLRQIEARGCLVHDPVEKRGAQTPWSLKKKFGDTIPLTRQEIAELTGTTVETVIRTISRFQQEGWVHSSRGKVQILNTEALSQLFQ